MMNNIYYHNRTPYKVLRTLKVHSVSPKGVVNMDLLKEWRDYVGADHVLQKNDEYWLCETIKDAEIVEEDTPILEDIAE
jgi:hypothetical protein